MLLFLKYRSLSTFSIYIPTSRISESWRPPPMRSPASTGTCASDICPRYASISSTTPSRSSHHICHTKPQPSGGGPFQTSRVTILNIRAGVVFKSSPPDPGAGYVSREEGSEGHLTVERRRSGGLHRTTSDGRIEGLGSHDGAEAGRLTERSRSTAS